MTDTMMTGQQMCEYIADIWFRFSGVRIEPERIWNMSPTGELWPVFEMYHNAKYWDEMNPIAYSDEPPLPLKDRQSRSYPELF